MCDVKTVKKHFGEQKGNLESQEKGKNMKHTYLHAVIFQVDQLDTNDDLFLYLILFSSLKILPVPEA